MSISQDSEKFQPSEVWTPSSNNFELEPSILSARQIMNNKNPARLIESLKSDVRQTDRGIIYAVLKGDKPEEYSTTDALVSFNPFANTATANMLVRAEFIREVAKQAEVRDEDGKLLPVIMLASPGLHGSRLKLSNGEKKQLRKGELGPAAKEYLNAVSALEYGRVALLGASQGADMAIAGSNPALTVNLDRTVLAIAEPAGVVERSLYSLGNDFRLAGPDINERATGTGLTALNTAHGMRDEYYGFWLSSAYPMNWRNIAKGMAHANFESQMQTIIDSGEIENIVVGYGSQSTITPAEHIEPSLAALHAKVHNEQLLSVKVMGGTHAWSEELTVLAKLYIKALT